MSQYGKEFRRKLPFLANFEPGDRQLAEKALEAHEERRRKAQEARREAADAILVDARRQLSSLLGVQKLAQLRQAMERERLAFRDLRQPPGGLGIDFAKENQARKLRIDGLVKSLGASPDQLRMIGKATQEKLRTALSPVSGKVTPGFNLQKNLDQWKKLSPLHERPLPWGDVAEQAADDPHRWFVYRPGNFWFYFTFESVSSSNFVVSRELVLDAPSGLVGHHVFMDCNSADNSDYAGGYADTEVAFGFQAPATGLVEVLIDAQSTVGKHRLRMEDEWGWSESWTYQSNHLMMNVFHPNVPEPSFATMSDFYREFTGSDQTTEQQNLTVGQHYYAHLYSTGPVQAGQSVAVTAGTWTFDQSFANDVEVHSTSRFEWFISSVQVRIAP